MDKISTEKLDRVKSLMLKLDELLSKKDGIEKKSYYESLIKIYHKLVNISKNDESLQTVFLVKHLIEKYIYIGDYKALIKFLDDYGYDDTVIEALKISADTMKESPDKDKKILID